MVQYQEFPKELSITFETMKLYLLKIFEKINSNLECHLDTLSSNPVDTNIM